MTVRFDKASAAAVFPNYKADESVWIGGGAALGDSVAGWYVYRRASTEARCASSVSATRSGGPAAA